MAVTLGHMADTAASVAKMKGHRLTPWVECRDVNGMKWVAACRTCGAMALAEHTSNGGVSRAGTTQTRKCEHVMKSKRRRSVLKRSF